MSFRYRGYLPHMEQADYQMITYRLADALPQSLLREIRRQTAEDTQKRKQIEAALDQGYGACWLRHPETAAVIIENWRHFHGQRYDLVAFVVMPNHVHLLIRVYPGELLSTIVQGWKSYTAKIIHRQHPAAGAQIWQEDYWDRFIRNETHYQRAIHYIHENPVTAGLAATAEQWPFSSASLEP